MKTPFTIETYKARDGIRWRIRSHRNNKIVAESGEAYASKGNVKRSVRSLPIDWSKVGEE